MGGLGKSGVTMPDGVDVQRSSWTMTARSERFCYTNGMTTSAAGFGHRIPESETPLRARARENSANGSLTPWQTVFCEALRRHQGSVVLACEAARVSKATAYRVRRESTVFASAWDDALGTGRAEEEAALFKAAVQGAFEPVYDGGEIVAYVRRRSHAAAAALLKRRQPELFASE